ncbi:unnamed protein product [Trichogramma brassicae]|uniref:Uncharacterized protein n=1 Tax=Trichogramma brassicae TaxID=86971 RepID=A0A6H5J235_9HYME|nr:unnamed protein product [Trichogramma brassicae]
MKRTNAFLLQQTIGQWRLVFLVSAANLAVSCVVHLIWGTSEEQPWNNYAREKRRIKDAESASPAETKEFIEAKTDEEDDKAKGEVKAEHRDRFMECGEHATCYKRYECIVNKLKREIRKADEFLKKCEKCDKQRPIVHRLTNEEKRRIVNKLKCASQDCCFLVEELRMHRAEVKYLTGAYEKLIFKYNEMLTRQRCLLQQVSFSVFFIVARRAARYECRFFGSR